MTQDTLGMKESSPVEIVFNREWKNQERGFVNYYFDIRFEDGTVGQFSTNKKEQTKFTLNQSVKYKLGKVSKAGTQMIEKVLEEKPTGRYNDPKDIDNVAFSVCQDAAVESMEIFAKQKDIEQSLTEEDVNQVAIFYHKWVSDDDLSNRNRMSIRWNTLKNAVKSINLLGIENFKGVLETAKTYLTYNDDRN